MKLNNIAGPVLIFFCALLSACSAPQPRVDVAVPDNAQQVITMLRAGGLHIYLRHAQTDWEQKDAEHLDYKNCDQQRNLSREGRIQGRAIGAALRELGISAAQVLASPFCRCVDTAKLVFGKSAVQPELLALAQADLQTPQDRVQWLQRQFASEPEAGVNVAYISHQFNFIGATGTSINEADAAIVKPRDGGGFDVIAVLTVAQWQELARRYPKP